jgi:hypothetical protein
MAAVYDKINETGADAIALCRVAVSAAPHSMRALKMAANAAAVAASWRAFMI